MAEPFTIRSAVEADAPSLLDIYRPFVEDTAVSFETVAPGIEEFAARIAKAVAGWQWLVAERDGQCIGYAYGSSHRERSQRGTVEVSDYSPQHHRQGVGRASLCSVRSWRSRASASIRRIPENARSRCTAAWASSPRVFRQWPQVGMERCRWLRGLTDSPPSRATLRMEVVDAKTCTGIEHQEQTTLCRISPLRDRGVCR